MCLNEYTYICTAFPYKKCKMVVWKPLWHIRKTVGSGAGETLIHIPFDFEIFHILAT